MPITYLTGPAGTGKTIYAVEKLRQWLLANIPASAILVLTPQRTLAQPYRALLTDPTLPGAGAVDILTLNGLAAHMIDLFWPLGAVSGGFGRPQARPIFLDIEQAQYYLRQAIDPLLKEGYFDPNVVPLTISLPRLMSQILDNLNKAALMGLPHTEVSARLAASLPGDAAGRTALDHTQVCVNRFRDFCLERNLLDFSLRIEMFYRHLWPTAGLRRYLTEHYRYLLVDNIEEDTPFAHTVLADWLPHTTEAVLVHDEDAGYRIFLGASRHTAAKLQTLANETLTFTQSHVAPPPVLALGRHLSRLILGESATQNSSPNLQPSAFNLSTLNPSTSQPSTLQPSTLPDPRPAFTFEQPRFYPQMLAWVVNKIEELLKEGTPPAQIVVLAPFVSDSLRFAFTEHMHARGLPVRSHRPSRPLNEEPAAKTMLTLARLAFPEWRLLPEPFDIAQALHQAITDLDLIRANLLARVVYRPRQWAENGDPAAILAAILTPFEQIEGAMRERISYQAGVQFDALRAWLLAVPQPPLPPVLDHFFGRLFGEVLSQPGFGFHANEEAGQIAAQLIDSARQFRQAAAQVPLSVAGDRPQFPHVNMLNRAYVDTIEQGIAAAQYVRSWEAANEEAVLITPATTFLMSNRPVLYQFWLDAGSPGWWERIAQPLTHPYVLSAGWEPGRLWTDADEVAAQRDRLHRLALGLTRRCRRHIFIVNSEISDQGYEQRGALLLALQKMARRVSQNQINRK
jgi:superfamily I DNA/RNA helicase